MRRTLSLVLVTAVTGCRLYGAPFAGPAMPVSEYADTEAVTNFFLSVIRDDVRVFAFSLEFAATPSNNVEVAFGRDADGDGVLGPHELALLVGWDCGAWKAVDCLTGDETNEAGADGDVRLDWRVCVSEVGVPRQFVASASSNTLFSAFSAQPPRFLYSVDWDTVRVVCRGMDWPCPGLTGSVENLPFAIRIR